MSFSHLFTRAGDIRTGLHPAGNLLWMTFRGQPQRLCNSFVIFLSLWHNFKRWECEYKSPSLIVLPGSGWELLIQVFHSSGGRLNHQKNSDFFFFSGSLAIKQLTQSWKGTDSNTHTDYFILRTFKLLSPTTHIPNISVRSKGTFSALSLTQSHTHLKFFHINILGTLFSDWLLSKNYLVLLPSSYIKTHYEMSNTQESQGMDLKLGCLRQPQLGSHFQYPTSCSQVLWDLKIKH